MASLACALIDLGAFCPTVVVWINSEINLWKCWHYFRKFRHFLENLNFSATFLLKLMETLFVKLMCRTPETVRNFALKVLNLDRCGEKLKQVPIFQSAGTSALCQAWQRSFEEGSVLYEMIGLLITICLNWLFQSVFRGNVYCISVICKYCICDAIVTE